jgi:Right handed beta helix region
MRTTQRTAATRAARLGAFALLAATLFVGAAFWGAPATSANHPVLVEGNCDSPVPGTVNVPTVPGVGGSTSGGICGDFDGDGRIGTAEDTDGADRIFGTINAALGPGTGAAAGTGANQNGRITIVESGRFSEIIYIGQNITGPGGPGIAVPGNVTLEAAPGVSAVIDAVFQGDPVGGNNSRQNSTGISIVYQSNGGSRVVVLRNLTIRNFNIGVFITNNSRVHIDDCNLENNFTHGIRVSGTSRVMVTNTQVTATGFRVGTVAPEVNGGQGLAVEQSAQVRIANSDFTHNGGFGIANFTGNAANLHFYQVTAHFNGVNTFGPFTTSPDNNFSTSTGTQAPPGTITTRDEEAP